MIKLHQSRFLVLLIPTCLFIGSCQKKSEDSILSQLFDSKYTHDTIETVDMADNSNLINSLTKELESHDFSIDAYQVKKDVPEFRFVSDCDRMVQFDIDITGMRFYSVKSNSENVRYNKRSLSKRKFRRYNYEFEVGVYEFENERIAKNKFEILEAASLSGQGYCNKIFNTRFVLKKNEILEFSTMDEKSLKTMRKYIDFVKNQ